MQQSDIYTAEEFAEAFYKRGYGGRRSAMNWLAENGQATALEEDFVRCYHDLEDRRVKKHDRRCTALCVDGQNPVSPGNFRNSYGKSFAAEMAEEIRISGRHNKYLRERYEEANQCT